MIKVKSKGDFSKTYKYLQNVKRSTAMKFLEKYAAMGVKALSEATPTDTGLTASSWYSDIERTKDTITISFNNSHINKGVPIAIILQYGHATRNGGWVEGVDYINPALKPIFDKLADEAWKEVTKA